VLPVEVFFVLGVHILEYALVGIEQRVYLELYFLDAVILHNDRRGVQHRLVEGHVLDQFRVLGS